VTVSFNAEEGRTAQQTNVLLVVGDAKWCNRFPVGGCVNGNLVERRVRQALNDAPNVLINFETLEQCRLAVLTHITQLTDHTATPVNETSILF